MAINQIASVAGAQASQALESGKQKFGKTLEQVNKAGAAAKQPAQPNAVGNKSPAQASTQVNAVKSPSQLAAAKKTAAAQKVDGAKKPQLEQAGKVLDQVSAAQA